MNKPFVAVLIVGLLVSTSLLGFLVGQASISTGTYYLDTPLPIADYYVGAYTNGSYFAINGTNWDNFLVNTNATYVMQMVLNNATNGDVILIGNGTYALGAAGLILPDDVPLSLIGAYRDGVTFTYSGTDWAIKSANTVEKTGYYTIKDLKITTSNPTTLGGGLLINYPEECFIQRVLCSAVGKIAGSAGIKIHEVNGNTVVVDQCSTAAFDYGFWCTADWVLFSKCMSNVANVAFYVSSDNTESKRPIETVFRDCLAFHFYKTGYGITYAHAFMIDHSAAETGAVDPSHYAFCVNGSDSTCYGSLFAPMFHDDTSLDNDKRFYFSTTMMNRVWKEGKWLHTYGRASITGAVNLVVVDHSLYTTPNLVWVTGEQNSGGDIWITDKNAENFTINFVNQPGASTWYFQWEARIGYTGV